MCIAIVCWPECDVINSEIKLTFPIKPIFLLDQKVKTKIWVSWEQKELLRLNKKNIFHYFKELSDVKIFLRPESAPLSYESHVLPTEIAQLRNFEVEL